VRKKAARCSPDGGVASSATPTYGAQRADDNDERATRTAAVASMKIRDLSLFLASFLPILGALYVAHEG